MAWETFTVANSLGETVGDMIVRVRIEAIGRDPHRAAEIRGRFTPRSLFNAKWPPRGDVA